MMAADSLHVAVHLIVPSGVSCCWPSSCRRACSASASVSHFALPSAQPSHVQAPCLERARLAALIALVHAFAGALAAHAAAPQGRRCPERQRRAKAEGKIKGRGTSLTAKLVCTCVGHGTRQGAAPCRAGMQYRIGAAVAACLARWAALPLDGGLP
ncbi:hypothetical protein KYG_15225 [Acidovorax sp. NO-1]|uniref:hypothetical protein n=1 Tax=Acidovorax sp. NO-1 TaxID=512030 RepID=UPI00023FD1F6|nr:hypothetical protein [Acidovorax sp. NO-1]EHL21972.1 hypothetical protein KYG_15225 [Acidovorax sp. NO-1]